jgi:hypothetical protein
MLMKAIVTCMAAVWFASQPVCAEEAAINPVSYPKLVNQAATGSDFVPEGWKLEKEITADLNKDGVLDLFLMLKDNDPKNYIVDKAISAKPYDTNPRIIAVAFADPISKTYKLVAQDHTLIPRSEDPQFPDYMEDGDVSLSKGTIFIELFNFGSDFYRPSFQFRYQNDAFELIGYHEMIVERSSGQTSETSVNFSTGKIEKSAGTISSDTVKTKTSRLKNIPHFTINSIGDGFSFLEKLNLN